MSIDHSYIVYMYLQQESADDQCSVCGQLMGMSEFLLDSISQSGPCMFKLQRGKFAMKRVGNYSFVSKITIQFILFVQFKKTTGKLYNCYPPNWNNITNLLQGSPEDFFKEHIFTCRKKQLHHLN